MAKPGALCEAILSHQHRWAEQHCIDVSDAGHALAPNANLLQPLSPRSRAELARAPRSPLGDGQKPGDLQLLHSTDALLCNVFDYWRERELEPLSAACGADARIDGLRFAPLDGGGESATGAGGSAPPDLLLHGEDARAPAIVASFAEPSTSLHRHGEETRAASGPLLEGQALHGTLPGCHNLARDLHANRDRFRALPVVRLLDLCSELSGDLLTIGLTALPRKARRLQIERPGTGRLALLLAAAPQVEHGADRSVLLIAGGKPVASFIDAASIHGLLAGAE